MMPVYEYAHADEKTPCELGHIFEAVQSIKAPAHKVCPRCGAPIRRLISRPYISTPQSNSDLKSMGFAKLVKRDTGVYENVTALDGESRFMHAGKPETMPNIRKRIED